MSGSTRRVHLAEVLCHCHGDTLGHPLAEGGCKARVSAPRYVPFAEAPLEPRGPHAGLITEAHAVLRERLVCIKPRYDKASKITRSCGRPVSPRHYPHAICGICARPCR